MVLHYGKERSGLLWEKVPMGAPVYTSTASLLTLRDQWSFSVSSIWLWALWRQRLDLFMTKLPVAYTDTYIVERKKRKGGRKEERKEGRKEGRPGLQALICLIACGHCISSLTSLSINFFIWKMEIICNCIVVNYVKNALGCIISKSYCFESNNEYNNHLRIKLELINMEN